MHIGFTGTRKGMTGAQKMTLCSLLGGRPRPAWFHHGLCVGADSEAHVIAWEMDYQIEGHPPSDEKLMAKWLSGFAKMNPAAPYMVRNRAIVNASSELIATPEGFAEPLRLGGTWSTISYALGLGRRVSVIFPDGSIKLHTERT